MAPTSPVVAVAADPATRDEVVRTAIAVFGDSAAVTAVDSLSEEPVWDIDVRAYETHDRVEHYVELFSSKARDRFASRLSRGTRYEPSRNDGGFGFRHEAGLSRRDSGGALSVIRARLRVARRPRRR